MKVGIIKLYINDDVSSSVFNATGVRRVYVETLFDSEARVTKPEALAMLEGLDDKLELHVTIDLGEEMTIGGPIK